MHKCINFQRFMRYLVDDEKLAEKGARIVKALLEAQSPRLTDISEKMVGKGNSCYKEIQRFIKGVDLKTCLRRLYQEEAEFVIGDPTEMERYKAPKTSYVGTLKDGKTAGYWLLVLSTPFRGRSLPCSFVVYSSRTIGEQCTSRNQEHYRCFSEVKELLGDRPLVLDREFSYEELMEILVIEHIQFIIRLNLGDQHKQPRLIDADGEPIKLFVRSGETVVHPDVSYLGTVKVNLIGHWQKGLSKPLWVITTVEPIRGLEIYQKRMKIEQTFRDCKDLLHLTKLMNKKQPLLEQMGNALATRSESQTLWEAGNFTNKSLLGAVLLTFVLQLAVIYIPFLQGVFKTNSLSLLELGISLGASLVVLVVIDLVKVLKRRLKTA